VRLDHAHVRAEQPRLTEISLFTVCVLLCDLSAGISIHWIESKPERSNPMADQESVKAVITWIRNDLARIAATTDVDKLVALVLEKKPKMSACYTLLFDIFGSDYDPEKPDVVAIGNAAFIVICLAEAAQCDPAYKAQLVDEVAKQVPIIMSELDKFEAGLTTEPESTAL